MRSFEKRLPFCTFCACTFRSNSYMGAREAAKSILRAALCGRRIVFFRSFSAGADQLHKRPYDPGVKGDIDDVVRKIVKGEKENDQRIDRHKDQADDNRPRFFPCEKIKDQVHRGKNDGDSDAYHQDGHGGGFPISRDLNCRRNPNRRVRPKQKPESEQSCPDSGFLSLQIFFLSPARSEKHRTGISYR